MRLESLTEPELIFPALDAIDAAGVLRSLANKFVELGLAHDAEGLFRKLWEREQLGSTGIGAGVAIPHCKADKLERVVLAIGLAKGGVEFGAVDAQPVKLFFCIISPESAPAAHLQCLAAISRWVKADRHVERILELEDPREIYALLSGEDPE